MHHSLRRRGLPALWRRLAMLSTVLLLMASVGCKRSTRQADTVTSTEPRPSRAEAEKLTLSRDGITAKIGLSTRKYEAALEVEFADSAQAPLGGLKPMVWMGQESADVATNDDKCREKIRGFLSGGLTTQAPVNFNGHWILALNEDHTVSVINPQIALSRTKLEHAIVLPGQGIDWVLHPNGKRLFVSLPEQNLVAMVDLEQWLTKGLLATGQRPVRLALSQSGNHLWVANDGDGTVSAFDSTQSAPPMHFSVGPGHHEFVLDSRNQLWVSSSLGKTVSVFDADQPKARAELPVEVGAVSLAFSSLSNGVYLLNEKTGKVQGFGIAALKATTSFTLSPGGMKIAATPSGRHLLVVNNPQGLLEVVDVSSPTTAPRVVSNLKAPDNVTFSDRYAYVRNRSDAMVRLIDLASLERAGAPIELDVPFGQSSPNLVKDVSLASAIVPSPEGNGVMGVNPADKSIYVYQEGMMAPIGTIKTSGRASSALLNLDRSLKEVSPGRHQGLAELPSGGDYNVYLLNDAPRFYGCVRWSAPKELQRQQAASIGLKTTPPANAIINSPIRIAVELASGSNAAPKAEQLEAVLFKEPGTWQLRPPVQADPTGKMFVNVTLPEVGWYRLSLSAPSLGSKASRFESAPFYVSANVKPSSSLGDPKP